MDRQGKPATRAKNKYNAKKYDNLRIVVPKGRKQTIRDYVEARDDSINGLVNRLLRQEMGIQADEWEKPAEK